MGPPDTEALEEAAWREFVLHLGTHLAGQWPAMQERLGERYDAFVERAVGRATERGLGLAASVARFVNLWFVWGPAFHDKPGFEWAQHILAAPREQEWATVHQLVRRSLAELQRLPGTRIEPQALEQADARVLDTFGHLGRRGALLKPPPLPLPRVACDVQAADLRLLDDGWHHEYRLDGDAQGAPGAAWQRVAVPVPAPLRVDAARPLPALLGLLSHPHGQGPQARLQARVRSHAAGHGDVHPALAFSGPHGRWAWAGHETRAVSWPLATREQPLPGPGPGCLVAEESSPEIQRLEIEVCGLRDEGDPVGSLSTQVWVWPAAQWWLELQRAQPPAQAILPGPRPWARGLTRCRVERDGQAQDSTPLKQQFEDGLDAALAVAVQKLAAAWEALPGLATPTFDAGLGLLAGKAAITWGWRAGPAGLGSRALMRVQALFEMQGCQAELQFGGEFVLAGTRSRITLRAAGQAAFNQRLQRELPEPPLLDALLPALVRWRFPFELSLEPLASEQGTLLQQAGPVGGALVGEAGLRPCTRGSSGWEWFAGLRVEPVLVPLQVCDPVLGPVSVLQPLLPALKLIDWGLG